MTDRRDTFVERDLERALVETGYRIEYPPTPDLAARIRARIEQSPATPPPRRLLIRRWSWAIPAAIAAVLAICATILLTPPARDAITDWFGLSGVEFVPVPDPATGPVSPTGTAAALLIDGQHVTLEQAREMLSFPIRLPATIGVPDIVTVAGNPPGGRVSLAYVPRSDLPEVWETGAGLLITQFRGAIPPFIQKGLPSGTTLMPISVDGGRGYWISGAPHRIVLFDGDGGTHEQPTRPASNTLLWERDGITYRLESSLDLEAALRIAESMR